MSTDVAGSPGAGQSQDRPQRLLVAGLCLVVVTVAVLQTAVVPVLGVIAMQLHASPVAINWAVTANLLAAAATTPTIGRLADLHNKKRVLLGVLLVVLVGSVLASTTASLPLLVLGRVLQAVSFSLYPISVAILREEFTPRRLTAALPMLSGALGFGGGVGLVVVGLIMRGDAGYHRVFWLTTAFTVLVIIVVLLVVPSRDRRATGSVDWLGAAGLAAGLSTALLAITRAQAWGWTSEKTLGCVLLAVVFLIGWWYWERRRMHPLVSVRMLGRRAILFINLATLFVGMGLYFAFLGLMQFVQVPRDVSGYGFGASVLGASVVYQLPGAITGFLVALVSGRFIDRIGSQAVLMVGGVVGMAGFLLIALSHSQAWQVIIAAVLVNAYISLAYGALPALVVSEVESHETGVATGMNAIARTLGGSVAAAVVAVLLSRSTGTPPIPLESGFAAIFFAGAGTAALVIALIAMSRPRTRGIASVEAQLETRVMNHEWG
ncbi:MFS transporter [Mycobacterium colombiense]|nr:MFS transporter [Mycobacterium colombiense]OBK63270.1 MFS transporter [Mycobacterium colombiense]